MENIEKKKEIKKKRNQKFIIFFRFRPKVEKISVSGFFAPFFPVSNLIFPFSVSGI
jgi:hypothetical protein